MLGVDAESRKAVALLGALQLAGVLLSTTRLESAYVAMYNSPGRINISYCEQNTRFFFQYWANSSSKKIQAKLSNVFMRAEQGRWDILCLFLPLLSVCLSRFPLLAPLSFLSQSNYSLPTLITGLLRYAMAAANPLTAAPAGMA